MHALETMAHFQITSIASYRIVSYRITRCATTAMVIRSPSSKMVSLSLYFELEGSEKPAETRNEQLVVFRVRPGCSCMPDAMAVAYVTRSALVFWKLKILNVAIHHCSVQAWSSSHQAKLAVICCSFICVSLVHTCIYTQAGAVQAVRTY